MGDQRQLTAAAMNCEVGWRAQLLVAVSAKAQEWCRHASTREGREERAREECKESDAHILKGEGVN
jgi:hypothetical protein